MNTLRPEPPADARPTVRYRRCGCGGAEDPTHRCVDPVDEAFALWLAAEAAEERLTPEQRLQFRRRRVAHVNDRTTARLAAGPP